MKKLIAFLLGMWQFAYDGTQDDKEQEPCAVYDTYYLNPMRNPYSKEVK